MDIADKPGTLTMADIGRTPDVLQGLIERGDEIAAFTDRHLTPEPGGKLFAFGCGDGLCASEAIVSERFAARTALDFLIYDAPTMSAKDRALAISMSGNVDRGLQGLQAAMARDITLGVLTQGDGGRLAETGAPVYSLKIPVIKPFLCGTASYAATALTLLQITRRLSGKTLADPVAPMRGLLDKANDAFARLSGSFTGIRILSAGCNRATAAHAAEKMVEITRVRSWSADIEEYAHSQFWASDPGELIVYISANPAVAALASHGASVLGDMGFRTLAIETQDCPVEGAQIRLTVPKVPEYLSPVVFALPVQALAWRLSLLTDVDPDIRVHIKGDPVRFTTSRRLTRQALVGTGR